MGRGFRAGRKPEVPVDHEQVPKLEATENVQVLPGHISLESASALGWYSR
jgi:hypothetical protein